MSKLRFIPLVFLVSCSCSSVPKGTESPKAQELADKMLRAARYEAWEKKTAAIEFVFREKDYIFWDKKRSLAEVSYKSGGSQYLTRYNTLSGRAVTYENGNRVSDPAEFEKRVKEAIKRFVNDTFWLNPAYHLKSPGVKLSVVEDSKLLVTYTTGGVTPGDSYLFTLDEEGKITEMQMWVSVLPIKGMIAKFSDYVVTETGLKIARKHTLKLADVDLKDIKSYAEYPPKGEKDRFEDLATFGTGMNFGDSLNRRIGTFLK